MSRWAVRFKETSVSTEGDWIKKPLNITWMRLAVLEIQMNEQFVIWKNVSSFPQTYFNLSMNPLVQKRNIFTWRSYPPWQDEIMCRAGINKAKVLPTRDTKQRAKFKRRDEGITQLTERILTELSQSLKPNASWHCTKIEFLCRASKQRLLKNLMEGVKCISPYLPFTDPLPVSGTELLLS